MDAATRASLEIPRGRDGGTAHTLLGAVQRTTTAAGARLLASWLAAPLTDPRRSRARQDALVVAARELRCRLPPPGDAGGAPDMARALGRLSVGAGRPGATSPRVRAGLAAAPHAAASLVRRARCAAEAVSATAVDPEIVAALQQGAGDAACARGAGRRRDPAGVRPALDAERALRDDSRRVLATLQLDYAQRYGVASLKIRHHAQLGYVIEAPAAAVEKLRAQFRNSPSARAWRTAPASPRPELSELDRRIAEAGERAAARERAIFARSGRIRTRACGRPGRLRRRARAARRRPVRAKLAEPGTWCRPRSRDDAASGSRPAATRWWRPRSPGSAASCRTTATCRPTGVSLLLTGPNMAGKSTFLRQNALIVVLAQAGLPVPAERRDDRRRRPPVLPRRRRRRPGARPLAPSWSK